MPKKTPNLGGTEADLEGQIEADLLNLNLETDDFGKAAMEEMEAKTAKEFSQDLIDVGTEQTTIKESKN